MNMTMSDNSTIQNTQEGSSIDVIGLVVLLLFYLAVVIWGIGAAKWYKSRVLDGASDSREVSLVAGRKLGKVIGIFTMTATTVGGGYINGTAESIATAGLCWTLAPFGICIGLTIGGLVFAHKMRTEQYLTMFDPFQQKYGHTMVALLYLAAICGDIFWSASVLAALGTSLSVIINMDVTVAVVISAVVAIGYTMFGQIVAVAYTDVLQLLFIVLGMTLTLPFVMTNPAVEYNSLTQTRWLGSISSSSAVAWIDLFIAMTLGSIPWQSYFQRVLSVKTAGHAKVLSVVAGFSALLLAVPPVLIGIVALNTNWNQTSVPVNPLSPDNVASVLPLTLRYLTPRTVAIVGLGAIVAAVMSSVDSAILSSASVFTHNIYKMVLRRKAPEAELMWMQRCAILLIGGAATLMAVYVSSIYGMFIIAADLVFVIMYPQLCCVVYVKTSNSYGSLFGFIVGLFLRLSAGEPYLSLPALIRYPGYDYSTHTQQYPIRCSAMVCSLVTILVVSKVSRWLFVSGKVSLKLDVFRCFERSQVSDVNIYDQTPTSKEELLSAPERSPGGATENASCKTRDIASKSGTNEKNYENMVTRNCGSKFVKRSEEPNNPFTDETDNTRL